LLSENKNYSLKEIAAILNKNVDTVKEHIANLKKEDKLKRVGSTKSGYWEVIS